MKRAFGHMSNFKNPLPQPSLSGKTTSVAFVAAIFLAATAIQQAATAQVRNSEAKATSGPDILTLSNGDQLKGKLLREANGTVTFHSDGAGDLTLNWNQIKSIQTSQRFAVLKKGQLLSHKTPDSEVPHGVVAIEEGKVLVKPNSSGSAQEIPQSDALYIVDESSYLQEVHHKPGWKQGWNGTLSAGVADVEATQNSRTFTSGANFSRTLPDVSWLAPRNRTLANVAIAYGSVSQPGSPTTKTNIMHAGVEYDWFLSPRLYALADASFDHNYSQGLTLQQIYGGGVGYVFLKTPKQELDLKGDIHYERQNFGYTPGVIPPVKTPNTNLIGVNVGDTYTATLPRHILFNQGLVVTPAFNNPSAFSALANASVIFPVYKRFGANLTALDNFLNNPAYGSKKNSFQFTAGITYTLK